MTRALVTGAAGFVGRWLSAEMVRQGMHVTGLTSTPYAPASSGDPLSAVEWRLGDVRGDSDLALAVKDARPDIVVHLAAISHVPTAATDPALSWDVNVTGTARLLAQLGVARSAGVIDPTVLIIGSAEQYGRHDGEGLTLTEEMAQYPHTVYAATKVAQEVLALQHWRSTGIKVVAVRAFNHSGPGQEPRFLLPALVQRVLAIRDRPANTTLRLGNLTPVRDFLHVSDVVAAYISLCRLGTPGEVYNVASGTGRTVRAAAERVLERVGLSAPLVEDPALVRQVDVPALVGDPGKLQRATGWRATRSFDDIIDDLLHAATH
jgi:GDP-4-dehydro-6-deoxy-D-mannose reductase